MRTSKNCGLTVMVSLPVAAAAALLFFLGCFPHLALAVPFILLCSALALAVLALLIVSARFFSPVLASVLCWGPCLSAACLFTLFFSIVALSSSLPPGSVLPALLIFALSLSFLVMLCALGQLLFCLLEELALRR
ncbi:MAG: hypothetical protein ACLSX2_10935 [Christensenellaceae bacterium]